MEAVHHSIGGSPSREFLSGEVERRLSHIGAKVLYFPQVPSTMRIRELADEAAVKPEAWQIYIAGHQVDGQGLTGPWKHTPRDVAMTFLAPDASDFKEHRLLKVVEGMAVLYALRALAPAATDVLYVKWPNDVHVWESSGTRKISGILDHCRFEDYGYGEIPGLRAIGVGVNLSREVLSMTARKNGADVPLGEIASSVEALQGILPPQAREKLVVGVVNHYHRLATRMHEDPIAFYAELDDYVASQQGRPYTFERFDGVRFNGFLKAISGEGVTVVAEGGKRVEKFEDLKRFYRPGFGEI